MTNGHGSGREPTLEYGATCANRLALLDCRGAEEIPRSALRTLARAVCEAGASFSGNGVDDLLVLQDQRLREFPDELPCGYGPAGYLFIVGADGRVADLCGNGLLFVAHVLAGDEHDALAVGSVRGLHRARRNSGGWIAELGPPRLLPRETARLRELAAGPWESVEVLDTGEPHAVIRVSEFDRGIDGASSALEEIALRVFDLTGIPGGVNVTFTDEGANDHSLRVRTFERGVRRLTQSCGTGAAAAAWTHRPDLLDTDEGLRVTAPGGEHRVVLRDGVLAIEASSERSGARPLSTVAGDASVPIAVREAVAALVVAADDATNVAAPRG